MRRHALLVLLVVGVAGHGPRAVRAETPTPPAVRAARPAPQLSPADDAWAAEQRQKQCTRCHVLPPPEYVPRGLWAFRIREMAERSMSGTGVPPGEESLLWQIDLDKLISWYQTRAPENLPLPEPWPADDGGLRFTKHAYNPPGAAPVPVIANVRLLDLDGDGRMEIVACDMGRGSVFLARPERSSGELKQIAVLANPDHAEMVDLDKDGRQDLLIADLGEFLPADHEKGSIVWLRQTAPLEFEKHLLIERTPRNADVQAADFDGDGDLDLVVASFGFHTVGGTLYYENQTSDWKAPKFEPFTVDARTGAIHVPPVDLNADGRMDFVGLISQQYEHVVAFLNRGPGRGFKPETIFRAVTPVWGSSGIQVTDIDRDGRLDVLMSNGDSLDDFTVRPFHGIRWLKNNGEFPYEVHDVAAMPGVHRVQAADLDGDGDQDLVACVFLPGSQHPQFQQLERQGDLSSLTSVGWAEQTAPGQFRPHTLERGKLTHTTLDIGDYDGDGDLDLVVGNLIGFTFAKSDTGFKSDNWVELWENQTRTRN